MPKIFSAWLVHGKGDCTMMTKMTAREVASLRATDKTRRVGVDAGLHLHIAIDGTKTWVVRYSINGRQRDYRLPKRYGLVTDDSHLSLADARTEAATIRALARSGVDIQTQQREAQLVEAKSQAAIESDSRTFTDLFNAWITDGVRRKDGNAELLRSFNANAMPQLGSVQIQDIDEHHRAEHDRTEQSVQQ